MIGLSESEQQAVLDGEQGNVPLSSRSAYPGKRKVFALGSCQFPSCFRGCAQDRPRREATQWHECALCSLARNLALSVLAGFEVALELRKEVSRMRFDIKSHEEKQVVPSPCRILAVCNWVCWLCAVDAESVPSSRACVREGVSGSREAHQAAAKQPCSAQEPSSCYEHRIATGDFSLYSRAVVHRARCAQLHEFIADCDAAREEQETAQRRQSGSTFSPPSVRSSSSSSLSRSASSARRPLGDLSKSTTHAAMPPCALCLEQLAC